MDSTTAPQSSASSPPDGQPQPPTELYELAALLANPNRRSETARSLAARAGAEHLIIFVMDPEVGVLLPAPGFRQTLPDARRWQAFLSELPQGSPVWGRLTYPQRGSEMTAMGVAGIDGSALVLLGGEPSEAVAAVLRIVLPVLAWAFRGEQAALAAEGHAAVARDAVGQAKLLTTSLESARRALQAALAEAQAANQAKDQFLAVLSHELRTPLAPVLTTATALLADPALPKDLHGDLEMIRRNVELEARLIDDLLDLTRVTKGKMPLTVDTVDIHALVTQTLEICQSDIYQKKQRVTIRLAAGEHHVRADPARLQQVLWNLVKNAVKFTPIDGRLEITSMNDGPHIRIDVSDSGIGIEPQFIEAIFDAFEQTGDEVTRRFGGLGLGLAISKAIIHAHNGRLRAASAGKGQGAVFSVILDVVPTPQRAAQTTGGPLIDEGAKRLKLLLVEDHPDTAAVMSRLLKNLGHDVAVAGSIADTLTLANERPFDLVLSDLGLPDGSGLDLMRQLSERFGLSGVAISGYGMEEDLARTKCAGFFAHLTKPINIQQVQAVISQFAATSVARK